MRAEPTSARARITAWARGRPRAVGVGLTAFAVVVLAAAAALGWSMFAGQIQVADQSPAPTQGPSASSQPSSRPSASSQPSVEPTQSPTQAPGGTFLYSTVWATSTVNDLNVRSGPGTEHAVVGRLNADDLVLVIEGDAGSWIHVAGDGFVGWANIGPREAPYLVSTPTPWKAYLTRLVGVASNGTSYLAYGSAGDYDYLPYEGGQAPLLLFSDDGVSWARETGGPLGRVTAVAGGPAGWVALSVAYPDVSLASFSSDGHSWEEGQPLGWEAVAFGPAGWVVLGGGQAWRSSDGRSWGEPFTFAEGIRPDRLESSRAGYVAFARGELATAALWISTDGSKWQALDIADPSARVSDVELVGNQLLVVLRTGPDPGSVDRSSLLRGTLAASGAMSWDSAPVTFPVGLVVDSVSQGSDGLIALGWDANALVPALWSSTDGMSWPRLGSAADTLGGSVEIEPAWGFAGWVAVGTTAEGAGQMPWGPLGSAAIGTALEGAGQQLFRSSDGQDWAAVGEPIALMSYPPCPVGDEVSTIELIHLGPFAARCFGDASLTIRGWVPIIDGVGGCCWPVSEPGWLAGTYAEGYITPGESESWWLSLPLYLPPGVNAAALQPGSWVEVGGHFMDPTAASCRRAPLAGFMPHRLESQATVRRDCQQRFVVESITATDGP